MIWQRYWRLPPRRLVLWHVVSALPLTMVVILGAFLSYHYHVLSIQSREREDRAYEVIDNVHRLVLTFAVASVAERNYVISGDVAALAPLQAASADASYARLRQLLGESPQQLARLEALQQARLAAWKDLDASVQLRRSNGFDVARAALATGAATRSLDAVRRSAADLALAERELLRKRQELTRAHEGDVLRIGVLIAFLSVVTRVLTAWILARMHKRGRAVRVSVDAGSRPTTRKEIQEDEVVEGN